jgi:hypothetical protein
MNSKQPADHGLLLQIFDVPPAGHQPALTQQTGHGIAVTCRPRTRGTATIGP